MLHPTKKALIDTALAMLEAGSGAELTTDEVLRVSGISRGSLYHHFADFDELIEIAYISRFAQYVDQSIGILTKAVSAGKNADEILTNLKSVTEFTQSEKLAPQRLERAEVLSMAGKSERMAKSLRVEQNRLTGSIADIFREAQEKGVYRRDLDPRTGAVFIQAYTLGRIFGDFDSEPFDQNAWNNLIGEIAEKIFKA